MKDMFNMAKTYLGDEGVSKLLNAVFSKIEKLGKKLIGWGMEGSESIIKALNDLPKESFEKEGDDSEDSKDGEKSVTLEDNSNL